MKKVLLSLLFVIFACNVFAQTYAEKAAAIQKEVWGTTVPEFQSKTVPDSLNNESAVVLARSYRLQKTSNGKIKFMLITAEATTRTVRIATYHERVKINDKVALKDFSTLEYQKKLDRSVSVLIAKFKNTYDTYIGAKILKPDGKEIIVDTGEEVLLRNESKDQKGKLAISALQVGDILDYYVSTAEVVDDAYTDNFRANDQVFMLTSEYPVMYFSLDFQFNKKNIIKTISANGAPKFELNINGDGDQLYSLKVRNLPKYQSELWTAPYRQFPYIEISSAFVAPGVNLDERLEANKDLLKKNFNEYYHIDFKEPVKKMNQFFGSEKLAISAPLDSSMKVLYNIWKSITFGSYDESDVENIDRANYRRAGSSFFTVRMSMALANLGIDHDVLMIAPRYGSTLENVFNYGDFESGIRINNSGKPLYMFFDYVTTHFNEIPGRFQGEKAIVLTPTRKYKSKYTFTEGEAVVPVIPPSENMIDAKMEVALLPNTQKLKIQRLVSETGVMRADDQKALLPAGDIDNAIMILGQGNDLAKRLSTDPKTRKMKAAFDQAFETDRQNAVKKFTGQIKAQYDQEPQQVADCKIINAGLDRSSPAFQFSSSFVLDNLVKKAGNNYIIEAGKLSGEYLKVEEKDRKRMLDVYMAAARTVKYTIALAIPQGYTAKGVPEFNKNISNKTGSFTTAAAIDGTNVNITVTRTFNSNFEKADAWPQLLELIDAAANYYDQKILLEKI